MNKQFENQAKLFAESTPVGSVLVTEQKQQSKDFYVEWQM